MPFLVEGGQNFKTEHVQKRRSKYHALKSLSRGVRRHEKPLEEHPVVAQSCPALASDPRNSEPAGRFFHKLLFPADIAASGGKSPARVLDKGARDQIRTDLCRLCLLRKLAVAVVDEYPYRGVLSPYGCNDLPYLRDGESLPARLSGRSLDKDCSDIPVLPDSLYDLRNIGRSVVLKSDDFVGDPVVSECPVFARVLSYDRIEGVVRNSRGREHGLSGVYKGKYRGGDGVRSVYEIEPHQRFLGSEDICPDGVYGLSSEIVVSVACGAREAGIGYSVLLESVEYLFGV